MPRRISGTSMAKAEPSLSMILSRRLTPLRPAPKHGHRTSLARLRQVHSIRADETARKVCVLHLIRRRPDDHALDWQFTCISEDDDVGLWTWVNGRQWLRNVVVMFFRGQLLI